MKSIEEIEVRLMEVTTKKNYWRAQVEKLMETDQDSETAYHNYRYWLAQAEALNFVLGIKE